MFTNLIRFTKLNPNEKLKNNVFKPMKNKY